MSTVKKLQRHFVLEYWDQEQPPENRQKRWEIAQNGEYTVGRSGVQSEIVIQHPSVSRKHVVLSLHDNTLSIREAGSANGTIVDGRPLRQNQQLILKRGMKIRLGECPNELTVSEQLLRQEKENNDEKIDLNTDATDGEKESSDSKVIEKPVIDKVSDEKVEKDTIKEQLQTQKQPTEQKKSVSRSRSRSREKINRNNQNAQNKASGVGSLPSYIQKQQNEIEKRRSLLWNSENDNKQIAERKKIWSDINATKEEKQRFLKRMGVKDEAPGKIEFIKKSAATVSKGEQLISGLEKQFYQSVGRKNAGKAGLGFAGGSI